MTVRYLRNRGDRGADVRAAVISSTVAACVGIVTFYLARLLLARELLTRELGREVDDGSREPQHGDS